MRLLRLSSIAALALVVASAAHADQESDRLREALRSATAQARAAEDQRAAVQAKLTAAEQERDRLRKQIEGYRAQVKEAEQAYRQAVKDFNERIAERDDSLEKWKAAYGEAASVARTKDAERSSSRARRRRGRRAPRPARPRMSVSSGSPTIPSSNMKRWIRWRR